MDLNASSDQLAILWILAAALAYLLGLSIYRRREGLRHHLRRAVVRIVVYLGVTYYLATNGIQPLVAMCIGALAGFGLEGLVIPKRSRHIRKAERAKSIQAFELKTGAKFNPEKHELDHEIAFARFGSSTADNLRVLERKANRRKGKKSPWWDLIGR